MNIDTATLHLLSLQRRLPVRTETDRDTFKALEMAIKALYQLSDIHEIIDNTAQIQEDVIRYQMICEVVKNDRDRPTYAKVVR